MRLYFFTCTIFLLGLVSCQNSSDEYQLTNELYSQEELNLFFHLTLGYPHYGEDNLLSRWEKTTIGVIHRGSPSEQDLKNLDELLQELNNIIPNRKFMRVEEKADIEIFFTELKFFKYIFLQDTYNGWKNRSMGRFHLTTGSNGTDFEHEIIKSKIAIPDFIKSLNNRRSTLRGMFIRSLGFRFKFSDIHKPRYKRSIFSEYYELRRKNLVGYEKMLLKLLHDPIIHSGDSRKKIQHKILPVI